VTVCFVDIDIEKAKKILNLQNNMYL